MLDIQQLLCDPSLIVAIEKRQSAHDLSSLPLPSPFDDEVPYQVPNCPRTRFMFLLSDDFVELPQEFIVNGYAEPSRLTQIKHRPCEIASGKT